MFQSILRAPRSKVAQRVHSSPRGLMYECLERRDMMSAGPPNVVSVEVASTAWSAEFVDFLHNTGLGTNGYSIPVGSSAQSATLPWSNINQIAITFNEDVEVDAADLSLSGVNTAATVFSDFRYDPQSHVATWTVASSLTKDRFRLDLDANGLDPVKDLDNNALDGEWTNNTSSYSSGNGIAGGDFEFTFNVLPGDIDNTGVVTYYDYYYTNILSGKSTTSAGYIAARDIDGSGLINSTDSQAVLSRVPHTLPTGSPAGTSNDAPTTAGIARLQISNAAIDHAISLWSAFGDAESADSALTYSIQSNSSPSLFDTVQINSSTGQLVVNSAASATGRARIVVRATDPGGLFTETMATIDVNRSNLAPVISNVYISYVGGDTYSITGTVTDGDDDVEDFTMYFWGVYVTRSGIDEDGNFEIALAVPDGYWGTEYMTTFDPHGLQSNVVSGVVGLT